MRKPATLALLIFALMVPAAETWVPHDHPASFTRTIYGFTAPVDSMQVAAEFPGRIATITVDRGDVITDGAVVQLDDIVATLSLRRTEAMLSAAKAAHHQSATQIALARRELTFQKQEVARLQGLAKEGTVAKQQLDGVIFARDRAQLAVVAAEAAAITAATAVAEAEQAVAQAADHVGRHQLSAPQGWIVADRHAVGGSVVGAGVPILHLVDTRELRIDLRLTAAEIAALRMVKEPSVRFHQQAKAGTAAIRIHRVDPRHDPVTNKRLVECRLAGSAAPEASGGLAVRLDLAMADPNDLVMVANAFVQRRLEDYRVRTTDGRWLVITPLRRNSEYTYITAADLPVGTTLQLPE